MPQETRSCERVRQFLAVGLDNPEAAPAVPEDILVHLSDCDDCLDRYLEAGLRRLPQAVMPSEFAARVLDRIAIATAPAPEQWRIPCPYFTAAAFLLAAIYAFLMLDWNAIAAAIHQTTTLLLLDYGPPNVFQISTDRQLQLLFLIGIVEMTISSVWLWKLSRQ